MLFFLLVGGVFFVFFGSNNTTITKGDGALVVGEKSGKDDADNDGLAGWEEALLGTDPENPDTNKNSVMDGEEFASVKKYLDIGLDDSAMRGLLSFEGRIQTLRANGDLNLTDAITQETALRYGVLGAGNELDATTFDQLLNSLASDFSRLSGKDRYSLENLSFTNDESKDVSRFYISSVIVALNMFPEIYGEDPLQTLSNLSKGEAPADAATLEELSASYAALEKIVSKLRAPARLARAHIVLANSFYHLSLALNDMGSAPTDPVRGMLGGAAYIHWSNQKKQAVGELISYFKEQNL
ncbi:MAG TPA: hypothetical protein VJB70_01025 [Candidatus Paceibacterota bacterium]